MIVEAFRGIGKVKARYVRKAAGVEGLYQWCEQSADDPRYDVAQGTCDAEDLPEDIRTKCDAHTGMGTYACEWPKDDQP